MRVDKRGNIWEGYYKNSLIIEGRLIFDDGSVYTGPFNDKELPHGSGINTFSSGNRYQGEFVNGRQHGFGTLFMPDGQRYEGNWDSGKQHGKGKQFNIKGKAFDMEFTMGAKKKN